MTKRTNRLSRMLVVTLAVMMILTGMNFGMGGTTLAWAENNNAEGATAPQSLTVELVNGQTLEDGTIIAKKGDVLRFLCLIHVRIRLHPKRSFSLLLLLPM